jgi:hypothetical protein
MDLSHKMTWLMQVIFTDTRSTSICVSAKFAENVKSIAQSGKDQQTKVFLPQVHGKYLIG